MTEDEKKVRALAQCLSIKVSDPEDRLRVFYRDAVVALNANGTNYQLRGGYFEGTTFKESFYPTWTSALKALLQLSP